MNESELVYRAKKSSKPLIGNEDRKIGGVGLTLYKELSKNFGGVFVIVILLISTIYIYKF